MFGNPPLFGNLRPYLNYLQFRPWRFLAHLCRGGDIGGLPPPTFHPGGRAPPNYLTTSIVSKLPYYWLGIRTVRREAISKLSSSSRRGILPLFSSPREESIAENALLMNINEQNFAPYTKSNPLFSCCLRLCFG